MPAKKNTTVKRKTTAKRSATTARKTTAKRKTATKRTAARKTTKKDAATPLAKAREVSKKLREQLAVMRKEKQVMKEEMKVAVAVAEQSGFEKGYTSALSDQIKLDEAFDTYMDKAAAKFEKDYMKKLNAASKRKTTRKTKARRK